GRAGGDQIAQDAIHRALVKDAHLAVAVDVKLERLELHAARPRLVVDVNDPEVGKTAAGTERGPLRAGKLDVIPARGLGIGKGLKPREGGVSELEFIHPGVLT